MYCLSLTCLLVLDRDHVVCLCAFNKGLYNSCSCIDIGLNKLCCFSGKNLTPACVTCNIILRGFDFFFTGETSNIYSERCLLTYTWKRVKKLWIRVLFLRCRNISINKPKKLGVDVTDFVVSLSRRRVIIEPSILLITSCKPLIAVVLQADHCSVN